LTVLGAVGEGLGELRLSGGLGPTSLDAGGDAANVCVSAVRFGLRSRLLGRVGSDGVGTALLDFWSAEGIDVSHVRRDLKAPTGIYLNERLRNGAHRFAYWRYGSAGSRLTPADMRPSFFDDLGVLVVTGVTLAISPSCAQTARAVIAQARRRSVPVACVVNHRPQLGADPELLTKTIAESRFVFASVDDLVGVFGDLDQARAELVSSGPPGRELAITAGQASVTLAHADEVISQAPPTVDVRDAAGAGDAFAGAYLASRLAGQTPAASLSRAVAAASLSVGAPGCASSYPTAEAADRLVPNLPAQARPDAIAGRTA
jgi:2-dehydro-3-deoxygluconokinase